MAKPFSIIELIEGTDTYKNRHGVVIDTFENNSIFITSAFPQEALSKVIGLEVGAILEEPFFIKLFNIRSSQDLDCIAHDDMLRFYQAGIMEITCMIDEEPGGQLVFKKTSQGLLVRDEDTLQVHQLNANLNKFADFVEYTTRYFLADLLLTKIN